MVTSVLASIFASGKLGLGLLRELVWRHILKNNFLQISLEPILQFSQKVLDTQIYEENKMFTMYYAFQK